MNSMMAAEIWKNAEFWRNVGCPLTADICELLYPQLRNNRKGEHWECTLCSWADNRLAYIEAHIAEHTSKMVQEWYNHSGDNGE